MKSAVLQVTPLDISCYYPWSQRGPRRWVWVCVEPGLVDPRIQRGMWCGQGLVPRSSLATVSPANDSVASRLGSKQACSGRQSTCLGFMAKEACSPGGLVVRWIEGFLNRYLSITGSRAGSSFRQEGWHQQEIHPWITASQPCIKLKIQRR